MTPGGALWGGALCPDGLDNRREGFVPSVAGRCLQHAAVDEFVIEITGNST